jgi:phosphoglucosamine mutase
VLEELGAQVVAIGIEPDGLNINDGVGSTSPESLRRRVLTEQADLGIAFDGDGDRVLFVDHRGELVDGDELLFIIACDQLRTKGSCAGVVGTLMSNMGFELALSALKIPFARAKVGDRYVMEMMRANGWQLGGENSGHIICSDVTTTGDGIISALKVLFAVTSTGKTLHELKSGMQKFPQIMLNVRVDKKFDLKEAGSVRDAVSLIEEKLSGRGRVLLRPSGTEPVVRVMVEGEDRIQVETLCSELAGVVQRAVA